MVTLTVSEALLLQSRNLWLIQLTAGRPMAVECEGKLKEEAGG